MRVLILTCSLGLLVACGESQGPGAAGSGGNGNAGGNSASGGQSMAGSSNARAGAPAGGGSEQGGGSSSGAGPAGGGGAGSVGGGGAGGSPSVSTGGMGMLSGVCEGAFQQPAPQILVGESILSSPTVTGDELELFFSVEGVISSYERASTDVVFSEATTVTELSGACAYVGGLDVSLDGLRLYIACSDEAAGYLGPLRLATRADRAAPFVLSPQSLGTVGASISISEDERTLYAVTPTPGEGGYTHVYERASLDEPFGAGELVQGLGGSFRHPEISPDGLDLFGITGSDSRLVVATRGTPEGPFSAPTNVGLPAPAANYRQFAPTVSESCRLYYLNLGTNNAPSTVDLLAH
jgi:hypothetical protein